MQKPNPIPDMSTDGDPGPLAAQVDEGLMMTGRSSRTHTINFCETCDGLFCENCSDAEQSGLYCSKKCEGE